MILFVKSCVFLILLELSTAFHTCEEVDFCSRFRYREPADIYRYDPTTTSVSDDFSIVSGNLSTLNVNEHLILSVQVLKDFTLRVKITESNSDRYELQDVLNGDPVIARWENVNQTQDDRTVLETDRGNVIVTIYYSPFVLEFIKNGQVEIILNGNNFILENSDVSKAFAFRTSFPNAVQLYGIHDHADNLALQTTRNTSIDPYRLYNVGTTYGEHITTVLYGSIPMLYGHGTSTSGIFLHNAAQQWWDIDNSNTGSEAHVFTGSGSFDLFVLLGPSPADVVKQYVELTGTGHLPQTWVLGYHQSRYSYMTQDEVKDVVSNFDSHNFQLDVMWLDIDYTDGFRYFTWNPETYSDPVDMQNFLASTNRKLVTIIDPHIKAEPGYPVYDGALEQNLFVHNGDGSVFQGNCWPGLSSWIDFLNPDARNYYASWYSFEKFVNSTPTLAGMWNDMNEPSVFDIDEGTMPDDALHYQNVRHRDIHNIYGMLQAKTTHQGLMQRDYGQKRPFILTRSYFAGAQRYATIWTGDNFARWEQLAISYPQCLNANMLGIVLCGADVAGYNDSPSDELFQRWYQAGIWLPFFRQHSMVGTNRREPYLYSEEIQNVVRNAIQLRYKHLPLWYTLAYEHVRTGEPLIRPLFYHYPSDENTFKIDNQLLAGPNILVRAVMESGVTSVPVYFPGDDTWLSITDSNVYLGHQTVDIAVDIQNAPIYYRQGSVIVRKETIRKNTEEMVNDGHTLFVSLGNDNTAHGTVYLDDNISFKYLDNLEYNYLSLDFQGLNLTISKIDLDSNSDNFDFEIDEIVFMNIGKFPKYGQPGQYSKKIYRKDSNGKLLKEMKFKGNQIAATVTLG